jgi:hypothetical protein
LQSCENMTLRTIHGMNSYPNLFPSLLIPMTLGLVSLTWYVGVVVMLFKIWQKVKHLPG